MLRLAALLLASTLLAPFAVSAPPTVQSYSNFTQAQFQSIADDVVAVPEIAAALPDGSVLTFVVKDTSTRYQGTVSGGKVALAPGGSGTGDAQLTASPGFWGALVNACDRANTAKLGVRDGYIGIDGGSGAKAAANGIKTGRFDAQLQAVRPSAGQTFACQGSQPMLQAESIDGKSAFVGEIEGKRFIINNLGALEGQLPSQSLTKLVSMRLKFDVYSTVSQGWFISSFCRDAAAALDLKTLAEQSRSCAVFTGVTS